MLIWCLCIFEESKTQHTEDKNNPHLIAHEKFQSVIYGGCFLIRFYTVTVNCSLLGTPQLCQEGFCSWTVHRGYYLCIRQHANVEEVLCDIKHKCNLY